MTTISEAMAIAIQHHAAGRLHEAEQIYRQVLQVDPAQANAIHLLGLIAHQVGQHQVATQFIEAAIGLRPDVAEFHNDLGMARFFQGQIREAIESYQRAIQLKPAYAEVYTNLASAFELEGDLDAAIDHHHRALAINPQLAEVHNNLGNALRLQGQMSDAIASYRRANELKPDFQLAHSNLIFASLFSPEVDPFKLQQEHQRWNELHAMPLAQKIQVHQNDRSPDRRLRIGYVSPDFRQHVVGNNLLPLFREHNRQEFELYCYSGVSRPDEITERFQQFSDHWRNATALSDGKLAEQIRKDRIDILVDLSLHMAGNRLLVFAQKPAPIQVTFAGYPGTTGLTAIDYRLTDPYLDPPGMNDRFYSEHSIRLPATFWCYESFDADLPVNKLPASIVGTITFGCLNNFCKLNPQMIRLWAQVLRKVPESRLMVLSPEGPHRTQFLETMNDEGINGERITFVPFMTRHEYLRCYHEIDLCLDTFPYNGHTTSLDAMWMGVPVVTLVGSTIVGRAGLSQLANLGLIELVAHSSDEFVRIAVDLAKDQARLANLRSSLRPQMQASPLMNARQFTQDIENAYRQMWVQWCQSGTRTDESGAMNKVETV